LAISGPHWAIFSAKTAGHTGAVVVKAVVCQKLVASRGFFFSNKFYFDVERGGNERRHTDTGTARVARFLFPKTGKYTKLTTKYTK
jgi:hypothetical protein